MGEPPAAGRKKKKCKGQSKGSRPHHAVFGHAFAQPLAGVAWVAVTVKLNGRVLVAVAQPLALKLKFPPYFGADIAFLRLL